jgi:hypothetical protein
MGRDVNHDQGVAMYYDDFTTCRETKGTGESRDIQELIRQRDKLLSDNPDLVSTQEEIDRLLSTTFDPVLRLEILFMLISGKIYEMRDIFEEVLSLARHVAAE